MSLKEVINTQNKYKYQRRYETLSLANSPSIRVFYFLLAPRKTMASTNVVEGEVDFDVPSLGKTCKTWYKIYGDLKSGVRPLIALHGGPGFGHNYLLSVIDLWTKHQIPVVFYDQIGCGKSTHLREKRGDESFWTVDLFLQELENLVQKLGVQGSYDVYGNSWGGMLGAEHAIRRPKGLNRLVVSDSPASITTWVKNANELRAKLPKEVEATLKKHEDAGTTDNAEYEEAVMKFYVKHVCRLDPFPDDVMDSFKVNEEDTTVYHTMSVPLLWPYTRSKANKMPGMGPLSSMSLET